MLSGAGTEWITASERTRLKHRLRGSSAEQLEYWSRDRANVRRYRSLFVDLDELGAAIAVTGASAPGSLLSTWGLSGAQKTTDGYVPADQVEDLVREFALVEDVAGAITIRAVAIEDAFASGTTPIAAIALDLADTLNTRERSAGLREMTSMLRNLDPW